MREKNIDESDGVGDEAKVTENAGVIVRYEISFEDRSKRHHAFANHEPVFPCAASQLAV